MDAVLSSPVTRHLGYGPTRRTVIPSSIALRRRFGELPCSIERRLVDLDQFQVIRARDDVVRDTGGRAVTGSLRQAA
jgi:hypothetical protein